jgi:hypothetical protein
MDVCGRVVRTVPVRRVAAVGGAVPRLRKRDADLGVLVVAAGEQDTTALDGVPGGTVAACDTPTPMPSRATLAATALAIIRMSTSMRSPGDLQRAGP